MPQVLVSWQAQNTVRALRLHIIRKVNAIILMNYSRDMDWPWLEGDLSLLTGNCLAVVWGELKDGETSTIAVSTCRLPPPLILACEATSQKQDPVRNFLISWQVCLIEIYTHLVHRSKCRKRKSKLYRPLRPLMQPRSTRSVSKMCTNLWHIMKLQWHWRSALNGICVILAGRCLVVRGCGNTPHNGRRHRCTQRQSPVTTFRHGCYALNLLDTV